MEYETEIELDEADVISLLYTINKGLSSFDYPTSNMVMAIIETSCISFMTGRGWHLEDEETQEFRRRTFFELMNTLLQYAGRDPDTYYWYIYWLEKMQERQAELETEWSFEEGDFNHG